MRRSDRQILDEGGIRAVLDDCKVCRLGLNDKGEVYIVPMNYGYTWEDGTLTLYFHCAKEGRRLSILAANPQVGFELDCGHALTGTGDVPCVYSYRFSSIIGTGRAELIAEPAEKKAALACIMRCQSGREFSFTEEMVQAVAVLQVTAVRFSCKEHK